MSTGRRAFSTSARARARNSADDGEDEVEPSSSPAYARAPQSPHSYTPTHPAIPSRPTWSIHELLHATGLHDEDVLNAAVSTEQMLRLHKFSALAPPETDEEMAALKESLRGSMRLVDLVRDGEIHPRVDGSNHERDSENVFHEVQSESARVIDWEHEHGRDGSLGAFFAEAYRAGGGDGGSENSGEGSDAADDVVHLHFGLGPNEREGTGVLDKAELLSRAAKTKGGYFYVRRGQVGAEE